MPKPTLVEQAGAAASAAPAVVQDPQTGLPFAEQPGMQDQGYFPEDPRQAAQATIDAATRAYYDNPVDKALALGEGGLSSLTVGGSDIALDLLGADTAGRAEGLPGWRTVGEVAGGVASLAEGGEGLGKLLAHTPQGLLNKAGGALGARLGGGALGRVAADAAVGSAFGVGQEISNITLHDPELSAEAIAGRLLEGGLFGAGIGAGAGLLGAGLGGVADKFGNKVKAIDEAGAMAAVDELDAETAKHALFPGVDEATTKAISDDFVSGWKDVEQSAMNAGMANEIPYNARDVIYSARMSRQLVEEAEGLVEPSAIGKELRQIKNARREISKLSGGSNELFDRPEMLDAGGMKALQDQPELLAKYAKPLDDWRAAAEAINEKAGLGGRTAKATLTPEGRLKVGTPEETEAMLAQDPHLRIRAVARGERPFPVGGGKPGLDEAIAEVNASNKMVNKAFGIRSSRSFDSKDLERFMLESNPAKAAARAQAMQDHLDVLGKFVSKFDDGAAGLKFKESLARIEESIKRALPAETSTMTATQLMQELGLKGAAETLRLTGHADDLMKAWIARAAVNDAKVVKAAASAKGGGVKGWLNKWGQSVSHRVGSDVGRKAAGMLGMANATVGGRMLQTAASMATGHVGGMLLGLVGGAGKIAEATGANTARIARATAKLASRAARAGSKATRRAIPTTLSLLNQYRFGDSDKKHANMQEAFKERLAELSQIAADPVAAQKRIHDKLEPFRQVHPMLGDHLEMQAIQDAQYLYDKAPKDPGGMNVLGLSRWKPSEDDIIRWAAHFRGLDPVGVWERVVSSRVTPQEAQFLRERRPATFAAIQTSIIEQLPEIQQNATYDQQNRMTILFDVPVNPFSSKHTSDFVQQQFAERAEADSEPVDMKGEAFAKNEPTPTQSLQSR